MMSLLTMSNKVIIPPFAANTKPELVGPDGTPMRSIMANPLIRRQFLPLPAGGAGGFNEAADVIEQLSDGTPVTELWAAYQQVVATHNAERQTLIDFLSYRVANPTESIPSGQSAARFERASEYGVPRAHRPGGEWHFLGFDFAWFDLGLRYTWEFLADATTAQVDAIVNQAVEADNILVFQMVMWTLFNNVNRQATIKKQPYTVYAFWNGDGEVPDPYRTTTFSGTHNHYLVSGGATVDPGDLADMELALTEHGYKRANGYDLILMVNKAQGDVMRSWRSTQNGGTAKFDFIPAQGTPAFLIPREYVIDPNQSTRPPATLRGMEVIGSYGEWTIVEEDYIPAGYMIGFATGGPDNVNNPVGIREHARAELRGMRLVKGRDPDYPLQDAYYQRGFGTGVRHRGAGVVMQIAASGTYTPPTEYAIMP